MTNVSIKKIIHDFNRSDFRKKNIPQEMVSGWPCIRNYGKKLCITIPFFTSKVIDEKVCLFPIYCSATIPLGNLDRVIDFTMYPFQNGWNKIEYNKPVGFFKHKALEHIKTKAEYNDIRDELFACYDTMVENILGEQPFELDEKMTTLFTMLMEPGHYPQYKNINDKFYSHFCKL